MSTKNGKSTGSPPFTIRIPPETKKCLIRIAKLRKTTIAKLLLEGVCGLVAEDMAKREIERRATGGNLK